MNDIMEGTGQAFEDAALTIAMRYKRIRSTVAQACSRVGRDPADVRIVGVSKTVGLPEIAQAIEAGVDDFGENRTRLFDQRVRAFPEKRWHFIGTIQTNKIKDFVGRAALVHSVASERALRGIARRAWMMDVVQPVLLEVNVSGEASKDGVDPVELPDLLAVASTLDGIEVQGLMTMAPRGDEDLARKTFRELSALRAFHAKRHVADKRVNLLELSMGMSEDYEVAVEEGATIIRVGRTLFGVH